MVISGAEEMVGGRGVVEVERDEEGVMRDEDGVLEEPVHDVVQYS